MIRRAQKEDMRQVYSLLCELEGEKLPIEPFQALYEHNLSDTSVFYYVTVQGEEIIGFASLHIQALLHHCGKAAEIQELVVREGCRSGGVGGALWATLRETASAQGCELLEVCCNQKRQRSHRFYTRCGMVNSHYKFTYALE